MRKKIQRLFVFILVLLPLSCSSDFQKSIDRKSVVERHTIISDTLDLRSPAQVGNGEFAFSLTKADGTEVRSEDLQYCRQEINLWTGIISSYFEIEGNPVYVKAGIYREEVVPSRSELPNKLQQG